MAKTISLEIDDDQEIQTIILKPVGPLAAALAAPPADAAPVVAGTSTATATATFIGNQSDVTADVNIDL